MSIASCKLFGSAYRVRTGRSNGSISGEASIADQFSSVLSHRSCSVPAPFA